MFSGLQKAVRAVGSVPKFANAIGVTHSTVLGWLKADGSEVPADIKPTDTGVRRAVAAAGTQTALAKLLGVSLPAVQGWMRQGWVPPARAQEIENCYGIPRAELVSPKVRNALGLGGEL